MKEAFEKNSDFEKIKVTSAEIVVHGTSEKPYYEIRYYDISDGNYHVGYSSYDLSIVFGWLKDCFEIVQEVAEEYSNSQINQLAMMYAKSLMLYGVDVTKELETATQQSYALEQAYIRGRQYERDRFIELRKEYNNGWIPCGEQLPDEHKLYDITFKNDAGIHSDSAIYNPYLKRWLWDADETELVENEVLAWAEKREPYSRRESESMKDGIHGSCAVQGWNCPKRRKKQTNADRIRSMSDEELAEFIAGLNEHCLAGIGECDCSHKVNPCREVCEKVTRKWLQSESE